MHVVTLLAQPRKKHPLVKRKLLQKGQLEAVGRGTFGLVWLTDFFDAFWAAAVAAMPKFTKESSAFKGKCYFCKAEIMVPTGPGWNSTRVICRACSLKQGDAVDD